MPGDANGEALADALPGQFQGPLPVVVAADQVLPTVETGEGLRAHLGGGLMGDVAEMEDGVALADGGVPRFDQQPVHLLDVAERPVRMPDGAVMADMRVAGEKHAAGGKAGAADLARALVWDRHERRRVRTA